MSPSWRSPLFRVHLAADSLMACEVHARRGGRHVVRKVCLPFVKGERTIAMQSLAAWMAEGNEGATPRRASQEWVLGIAEVRHLLLPWNADLADDALRSGFAAALFEQRFGEDPGVYRVCFARPAYGQAQLAAFVAQSLIAEIDAHVHASGIRLESLAPALASVWDRFNAVLQKECGVVHLVDGDRQLVVRHAHGRMHDVLLRPFDAGHGERLPSTPDADVRQRFFSTIPMPEGASEAALSLVDGTGFSAAQDVAYAFALCGVH